MLWSASAYAKKAQVRTIKISVEPESAEISVDNVPVGNGLVTFEISKETSFVVIKAECPGYKTTTIRFYYNDKRDGISIKLREDNTDKYLTASDIANKYMTINVSPSLLSKDSDGNLDTTKAWRAVQNVILNYFDEIQTVDLTTGFFQTPWEITKTPELDFLVRTRVTLKEETVGDKVVFKIKLSSEKGSRYGSSGMWQEQAYILKKFQPIIEEMQARLQSKL